MTHQKISEIMNELTAKVKFELNEKKNTPREKVRSVFAPFSFPSQLLAKCVSYDESFVPYCSTQPGKKIGL